VALIGRDAEQLAAVFDTVPCSMQPTMQAAVAAAREQARPGDVVLLSPACASFDMFDNFEHRGRRFAELVREMLP
jgi:UDP-N-acetylmuramoylalanine--D-glutamate ligase